jgi:hypothetical protein
MAGCWCDAYETAKERRLRKGASKVLETCQRLDAYETTKPQSGHKDTTFFIETPRFFPPKGEKNQKTQSPECLTHSA